MMSAQARSPRSLTSKLVSCLLPRTMHGAHPTARPGRIRYRGARSHGGHVGSSEKNGGGLSGPTLPQVSWMPSPQNRSQLRRFREARDVTPGPAAGPSSKMPWFDAEKRWPLNKPASPLYHHLWMKAKMANILIRKLIIDALIPTRDDPNTCWTGLIYEEVNGM